MTAAGATRHYHHGDLRHCLLESARTLLHEHGHEGLSLRALARAAGVSHAAPYRHFRDRAALLEALAAYGCGRLLAALETAIARVPHGPEQRLVAAVSAYLEFALADPPLMRLMFADAARADVPAARSAAIQALLVELVEAGAAAGVFRRGHTRAQVMVIFASMHGLAMLMIGRDIERVEAGAVTTQVSDLAAHIIYGIAR